VSVTVDRFRVLWDFEDVDGSERRLRAQLDREQTPAGRAEALTQLARVESLRGDFDACERLLLEAERLAGPDDAAQIRIHLERGRKLRSVGDGPASVRLFETAFALACEQREFFLAGDAAHMVAIADPSLMDEWTERGLDLAREPGAAYWAGPLLNNLAWGRFDAGEHERALELFERALAARERDPADEAGIAWARYGVAAALRARGRGEAAESVMQPALEWARRAGKPPDYFQG
jgi:tetratricopeptide (TPR) repeat protein